MGLYSGGLMFGILRYNKWLFIAFLLTRFYIGGNDFDVFVSVIACLLVIKSKGVKNFVEDGTMIFTTTTNGNWLQPSDATDVRIATKMYNSITGYLFEMKMHPPPATIHGISNWLFPVNHLRFRWIF